MPTPLSRSPLAILSQEFIEIQLVASESEASEIPLNLSCHREWSASDSDPRVWRLTLTVEFGGDEDAPPAPYTGRLKAVGSFRVAAAFPEDRRESLIRVTGASILFGACREMLANLTARGPHGMISLPSISFIDPKTPEPKKVVKSKKKIPINRAPKK